MNINNASNRFLDLVRSSFQLEQKDFIISLDEALQGSKMPFNSFTVCFLTDIIELDKIASASIYVNRFLVTTDFQAKLLSSCLGVHADWIHEPLDPFYLKNFKLSASGSFLNEVVIFGYSNSLERTLSPYKNLIKKLSSIYIIRVYSERLPIFLRGINVVYSKFEQIVELNDGDFRYSLLSDVSADLSLASHAKSLNKFYSSLLMNFVPIVISYFDKYQFLRDCKYPLVGNRSLLCSLDNVDLSFYIQFRDDELLRYASKVRYRFEELTLEYYNEMRRPYTRPVLESSQSRWPGTFFYSVRVEFKKMFYAIKEFLTHAFCH